MYTLPFVSEDVGYRSVEITSAFAHLPQKVTNSSGRFITLVNKRSIRDILPMYPYLPVSKSTYGLKAVSKGIIK
ncbi:hypothetical protein TSAR_010053 [Trichomalopsis sarcophagae]|uniref:Uncharacterized protein n=1 Tax=Trichomalopsis sarcophagae TaxID=543379 RepID=A0A232F8I2_9HYME|nr:hypothetical protein TSAR_010053 [Trichomalopsis sarcophagae]